MPEKNLYKARLYNQTLTGEFLVAIKSSNNKNGKKRRSSNTKTLTKNKGSFKSVNTAFERKRKTQEGDISMTNTKIKDRNIKIFTSIEKNLSDSVNDKSIISKLEGLRKKLKSIDNETLLVIYRQFGNISSRQTIELEIEQDLPYYTYTSMRRSSKMKVISHFKEDGTGANLQKLVEDLLLECCSNN